MNLYAFLFTYLSQVTGELRDVPDWSDYPDYNFVNRSNRSSQSILPKFPSASNLSDIPSLSRYDLIDFGTALELPEITNPYELKSFVRIVPDPDTSSEEEEEEEYFAEDVEAVTGASVVGNSSSIGEKTIRNWIFVDIVADIRPCLVVKSGKVLTRGRSQIPFETSSVKKPDVGVYNLDNECLLQIEVNSGTYNNTSRKLVFGIIDQLILQRNRCDNIMSCEGLYFPKANHSDILSVVKFEVTWSDSDLLFTVVSELIPMPNVILTIKSIIKKRSKSTVIYKTYYTGQRVI